MFEQIFNVTAALRQTNPITKNNSCIVRPFAHTYVCSWKLTTTTAIFSIVNFKHKTKSSNYIHKTTDSSLVLETISPVLKIKQSFQIILGLPLENPHDTGGHYPITVHHHAHQTI